MALDYSACAAEKFEQSAVPGAEQYRTQIREWLEAIDDRDHKADLRGRLSSRDNVSHYSARLEITLDGLFRRRGWNLTYHPRIRQVATHPDFLVKTPTGRFYCEAVLVMDDATERSRESELLRVIDGLGGVKGPFAVWLRPLTPLPGQLRLRHVRAYLERELRKLDPSSIVRQETITFEDEFAGHRTAIEFLVFPSQNDRSPVVNMWGYPEPREIHTYERVRASVRYKASKYGRLSAPYLIVVKAYTRFPLDDFQIERALYGDLKIAFTSSPGQLNETSCPRAYNGVFTQFDGGNATNATLSAVAFHREEVSDSGPEHSLTIYHNPFSRKPLTRHLFREFPQLVRHCKRDGRVDMQWLNVK